MSNGCVFCHSIRCHDAVSKAFQMFLTASGMQQGIYRDPLDVTFRVSGIIAPSTARPELQEGPISLLTHALTTRP